MKEQRWSSFYKNESPDDGNRLPLSLVSKVGFFICPSKIVPYDTDARNGLNTFLGPGQAKIASTSAYREYYQTFQQKFDEHRMAIEAALKERWVMALAAKLLGSANDLENGAFKHKVFDNYLVEVGRSIRNKTPNEERP